MLKDRRVLIENELKKAHDEAAQMYWNIVVAESSGDTVEYQAMRDKISRLEFDLNIVNQLIIKGMYD
jgi:hypothetical protein